MNGNGAYGIVENDDGVRTDGEMFIFLMSEGRWSQCSQGQGQREQQRSAASGTKISLSIHPVIGHIGQKFGLLLVSTV